MGRTAQLAFPFGAFLGKNMAFERLAALKAAAPCLPEALGRAAVGLDFWHLFAPVNNKEVPEIKLKQGKMLGPAKVSGGQSALHSIPRMQSAL